MLRNLVTTSTHLQQSFFCIFLLVVIKTQCTSPVYLVESDFYHPETKLWKGFTPVFQSFCSWGHAWQRGLPASFTPTSDGFVEGKSLLVVFGFYFFLTPPSGPPWNEGHRPRVHHETSVLEVLAPGTTRTLLLFKFYLCVYFILYIHGPQVSHITGRSRPLGEVGLTPRQYTEWNATGARTLYWRSLSVGAAA